ncbi:aminotransferase class I/II-fold pyridoxal phosphate-dependent enzyme [Allomuricauda sp. SCSIO 65647]|uniref:aminotransferase class I/II-fold pyridoxal phosphate-dependent enzyme n=1 Tax=Allomuricauda sp. SCSIO 65647 TaxID=2908843 RepID=UPI001F2484BE|nr:pyridoxal phosphate-dependent aminotransferase family protein [Muricauda sp. SCSIO 65647]UJH66119.1 pyridoxal phosphate-dependent aminotransferase family protein [Muricauda sp. SCSIO 65647]
MPKLPKKSLLKLERRREANALRTLSLHSDAIDFSSNDYLGFARNKKIEKAAQRIMAGQDILNGATGSRLLTGHHALLEQLETFLATYHNAEDALVFNSGYDANLGFFSSVPQRGDLIFYDELAHASIRDGIALGLAKSYKFKHNDIEDLALHIGRSRDKGGNQDQEIFVVTESVFSMDGDSPDLKAFAAYCAEEGLHLVVDEAHATGVLGNGKGLASELGIEEQVFARLVTFGKALGCHGAAILGSPSLKIYLLNFARSLIYSTALPPHTVATALSSYKHLASEEGKKTVESLHDRIHFFLQKKREYDLQDVFLPSGSAIHVAVLKGNKRVKQCAEQLKENGIDVRPILAPTVPEGHERLRICLHVFNTKEQITKVLQLITKFYHG